MNTVTRATLGFLVLFWSSMALAAPAMDLQQTVLTRHIISAEISPDGENIAYLVRRPWLSEQTDDAGQPLDSHLFSQLYVVNEKGVNKPFLAGNVNVISPRWDHRGKHIYFTRGDQDAPYARLYRIPLDGGQAQVVYEHSRAISGFAMHPDKQRLVFWGKKGEHKQSGVIEFGTPSATGLWLLDIVDNTTAAKAVPIHDHVQEASLHPTEDWLLVKTSPSADKDDEMTATRLEVIDFNGQLVQRFEHRGKLAQASFSPNGKHVAFVGSVDQHSPAAARLYVASIDKPGPTMLLSDDMGQVGEFAWLKSNRIGFILKRGTKSILASKTLDGDPDRFTTLNKDEPIMTGLSVSKNGRNMALVAHHHTHPAELFWYRNRKMRRITRSNTLENAKSGLKQSTLFYKGLDGQELEGVMVRPKGKPPTGGWPLVLFVHGGPATHIANGWLNRYSYPAYALAGQGYLVFFPNYRGSTGYGEAFLRANQGDFAGAEFDDVLAAKRRLVDEGWANPNRVAVAGSSYGGYAAAWAATAHSNEYRAGISLAGIGNQISKFGTTDIPRNMMRVHGGEGPWQNWQKWLQRSPIYFADTSKTPLLIGHGELDKRVPVSQAIELYRHLTLVGQAPVELVVYKQEAHGLTLPANQLDFAKRILNWLDTHLKNAPSSASAP